MVTADGWLAPVLRDDIERWMATFTNPPYEPGLLIVSPSTHVELRKLQRRQTVIPPPLSIRFPWSEACATEEEPSWLPAKAATPRP